MTELDQFFPWLDKDAVKYEEKEPGIFIGETVKKCGAPSEEIGCIAFYADSTRKACQYINEKMPLKNDGWDSSIDRGGNGFQFFPTWEHALDVFINKPWEIAMYSEADISIKTEASSGLEIAFDVQGEELDIGRYMHGEPECFSSLVMGNPINAVANIYIVSSSSSHIADSALTRKLERVCRLVDMLEENGIRTRVQAFDSTGCQSLSVIAKDYADSLYMPDVAVVCHPDFTRRVKFRLVEYSKTRRYGYGTPMQAADKSTFLSRMERPKEMNIFIDQGDYPDYVDKSFDFAEAAIMSWDVDASVSSGEWPVIFVTSSSSVALSKEDGECRDGWFLEGDDPYPEFLETRWLDGRSYLDARQAIFDRREGQND